MSSLPKKTPARDKIVEAAREIVENRGAGHLTFDELSLVSGVTRGGITYHFPTKDALLKHLVDSDMQQWKVCEAALTPHNVSCPQLSDLLGFIRAHTNQDENRRKFVSGVLSAAMHQPELLDDCRKEAQQRYKDESWDENSLRAYVLRLAAVGLFWDELFDFRQLPNSARADLVALLERLAVEWTGNQHSPTPDKSS